LKFRIIPLLALPLVALGAAAQGQSPPFAVADGRNTQEERLETMRESMKIYEFSRKGDSSVTYKLQTEPVFRFGKQGNLLDGAVFLLVDDVGRPEAAIQVFLERSEKLPQGKWVHEFTSLSTGSIVARRYKKPEWYPDEPGLEFHPVPDAPKPASTAAARLRQMRAIADEFHADDNYGGTGYHGLRMLTKPVARYGKAGGTVEDGAMFAFVEGTDSEAFLCVESRQGTNGLEWQYALAPVGCWAVKANHKGREVWDLPFRSNNDPNKPLFASQFWP
jgi:hypothetical protein